MSKKSIFLKKKQMLKISLRKMLEDTEALCYTIISSNIAKERSFVIKSLLIKFLRKRRQVE